MNLLDSWWHTPQWREYERICAVPISRVDVLRSATWSTQVIDLTPDHATLWRDLRGSYKPLIHKAQRHFRISVCDHDDANLVDRCRTIHRIDAGRTTRPSESWNLMGGWVAGGHGMFVTAADTEIVAYAYFLRYGTWSYYASAASLERSVTHALIWTAMTTLKANGVTDFEIGWQGAAQPDDAKGLGIEFLRRGFGGRAVPIQEYYQTQAA